MRTKIEVELDLFIEDERELHTKITQLLTEHGRKLSERLATAKLADSLTASVRGSAQSLTDLSQAFKLSEPFFRTDSGVYKGTAVGKKRTEAPASEPVGKLTGRTREFLKTWGYNNTCVCDYCSDIREMQIEGKW